MLLKKNLTQQISKMVRFFFHLTVFSVINLIILSVAHIEKFDWANELVEGDKPVEGTTKQWDSSKGSIFVQTFCEVLKRHTDMEIHKLTLEVNSKIKGYIDYINSRTLKKRNSELSKPLELPVCTSQLRNHFRFKQDQKETDI